jgi:cation:H+ antiporter
MIDILLILGGFIALVFGADKLVEAASSLAAKLGIPNIVIGLTIVAFGTSAPELVVNLFASINGNAEMVLGNVLGSNIFNVLGILGLAAIIYPLTVKTNTTWIEIPLSFLAAVTVVVLAADSYLDNSLVNAISRSDGVILLLFFSIFLVYNIMVSKGEKNDESIETKGYSNLKSILFIMLGLAGLIIGGKLIVDGATGLAHSFGISERIISLTILSIGTSLPELATTLIAIRKKNVDIAIGNVVGSNIFNIFFILGISTIVQPAEVAMASFPDIIINILASLFLFIFILSGKSQKLQRWHGFVLLSLYIGYIAYLLDLFNI